MQYYVIYQKLVEGYLVPLRVPVRIELREFLEIPIGVMSGITWMFMLDLLQISWYMEIGFDVKKMTVG